MHGLGVEMAKGVAKPPAIDLSHDVSCRLVIENRPAADRVSVRLSSRSPKEKHGRMLGFDNERFQPTWGDDSEVGVGHKDLSTMICGAE